MDGRGNGVAMIPSRPISYRREANNHPALRFGNNWVKKSQASFAGARLKASQRSPEGNGQSLETMATGKAHPGEKYIQQPVFRNQIIRIRFRRQTFRNRACKISDAIENECSGTEAK